MNLPPESSINALDRSNHVPRLRSAFPKIVLTTLLSLFTSCVTFQPEPLNPISNSASLEERSLGDPRLKEFVAATLKTNLPSWPPPMWDFEILTAVAFYYHPSLDLARAQWQIAAGANKTAAGRLNPVLTAAPGYNFTPTSGVSPWTPAVSLDVPIETAGKRNYRRAHAQHLSDAARLNILGVAWQVRANVRTNLIDYIAASEREALLEKQNKVQGQILRSLEERLQAGAVARSELGPARLAHAKLQVDLADARRQISEGRVHLAEALGVPARAVEGQPFAYDFSTRAVETNLLSSEARGVALQARADVLGALAEYAAAQSALQLEIAKQYPDVHLGPGYQYDQGDHKFTLSLAVELPLLNQNQGPIAEAQARRLESAMRFNALQSRIIAELDQAAAAYRISQENLSALEAFASTQREQNAAISAQVQAGAADPIDLLNSQIELGLSELAELEGRARVQQALGALEDTVQIPLPAFSANSLEQMPHHARKEMSP